MKNQCPKSLPNPWPWPSLTGRSKLRTRNQGKPPHGYPKNLKELPKHPEPKAQETSTDTGRELRATRAPMHASKLRLY